MPSHSTHSKKKAIIIAVIVFIVIMIIPVVLMGIYAETYNSLTTQEITKEQTLTDLAALALKVKLDRLVGIASSLAASPNLASDVGAGNWTDAADVARDLENNVNYYDPFIDRVIVFDASGTQQAAYPALSGGLGTNASSSAWYKALIGGGQQSYVSDVVKRTSIPQIQVVNIAVPVQSQNGIGGFVVLQIPTNNFLEFGENLSLGTYGFAYVVDSSGNIVAHPKFSGDNDSVVNYSSVPEVKKVIAGNSGTDIVVGGGYDEKSIVTYKPVENYGWGVITQELYSEAFATRSGILLELMILIIVLVVMDILVAYLVFRWVLSREK
jgi:methyl-accepting chemotaxis protein